MLLTGQPLHAFDLDRVAGGRLVVRRAARGRAGRHARRPDPHARPRRLPHRRRRGPDLDRRRSWAATRSEVAETTRRACCSRSPTGTAPSINATSTPARPAHRGQLALREGPRARADDGRAGRRDRAAASSYAGARLLPGTIDVGGPGPEPARPAAARGARRARCSASRSRASEQSEHLRALGFGVADADDGLDVTVPALAPRGRHPRGRPRRGDRAPARRQREPPRDAAVAQAARSACSRRPQRLRRGARRTSSSAAACYEIAGWSFAERALLDRLRIPQDSALPATSSRSRTR